MTHGDDAPDRDVATAGTCERTKLTDETVAGIVALARSLGYLVVEVDLAGCYDKDGLLDRTAQALRFPGWFGRNWDAWFDCLTDLSWQPATTGYVLLLRRAARLRQVAPEVLDTALAILEDATRVWAARGATMRTFVDAD